MCWSHFKRHCTIPKYFVNDFYISNFIFVVTSKDLKYGNADLCKAKGTNCLTYSMTATCSQAILLYFAQFSLNIRVLTFVKYCSIASKLIILPFILMMH